MEWLISIRTAIEYMEEHLTAGCTSPRFFSREAFR